VHGSIRIDGEASIPIGIHDLQSFREWAGSDDYPERGDFCWIGDIFWADLRKEKVSFEIDRRGPKSYVKAPVRSGKVRSQVLGHAFRLDRTIDRRGRPTYKLTYS
jgi:hypothetical protein